jgi:hypothetical protein
MRRLGSGLRLEERNVKRALLARRFAARHATVEPSDFSRSSAPPAAMLSQLMIGVSTPTIAYISIRRVCVRFSSISTMLSLPLCVTGNVAPWNAASIHV